MVCTRCGSIRMARARTTIWDRVIAVLIRRHAYICRRCGLRQRRSGQRPAGDNVKRPSFRPSAGAGRLDVSVDLQALDESLRENREAQR